MQTAYCDYGIAKARAGIIASDLSLRVCAGRFVCVVRIMSGFVYALLVVGWTGG